MPHSRVARTIGDRNEFALRWTTTHQPQAAKRLDHSLGPPHCGTCRWSSQCFLAALVGYFIVQTLARIVRHAYITRSPSFANLTAMPSSRRATTGPGLGHCCPLDVVGPPLLRNVPCRRFIAAHLTAQNPVKRSATSHEIPTQALRHTFTELHIRHDRALRKCPIGRTPRERFRCRCCLEWHLVIPSQMPVPNRTQSRFDGVPPTVIMQWPVGPKRRLRRRCGASHSVLPCDYRA
jgi:hypothetical protein